jgi:hypothetical protein
MTQEDIKYRQGKSQAEMEENEMLAMLSVAGLFITLFITMLIKTYIG